VIIAFHQNVAQTCGNLWVNLALVQRQNNPDKRLIFLPISACWQRAIDPSIVKDLGSITIRI
jgi:hypothetical protein